MKHLLLFALLLCTNFGTISSSPEAHSIAPYSIIVDGNILVATANDVLNADYVTIELMDIYGKVQASETTMVGGRATFTINANSKNVVFSYYSSQSAIIIIDIVID